MARFLLTLGIQRAHLVGYSLGGGVALHMAARHPEMVRSITTIGCGGVADPTGADDYEPEALIAAGQVALIERMKALHGEASGGDWRHHMRQSARDWRLYPNLTESDWLSLSIPMLLIGGENDGFATRQRMMDMQARCPQAEVWVVPGGSHRPHMPMEQIKEVNQRILDFLKNVK